MAGKNKTHYSQSGEWGNTKTCCLKYYTSDVSITGNKSKVTCKNCLKAIK